MTSTPATALTSADMTLRKIKKDKQDETNLTSRALSTPHLATNGAANDSNQSDSYEEILLDNNCSHINGIDSKKGIMRERIHSFSVSSDIKSQKLQHCLHHHKHNQDHNQTKTDDDDDTNYTNTIVDNCCVSNYATLNLDDQEIEKYFVNISSNFSRNSSIRRSCRNFNKSSTGSSSVGGGLTSHHTTPANSNRASPYIFDQLSNTVTCLRPKRATYYSNTSETTTSYSSMSSRNSTLSRNRSRTGSIVSVNNMERTERYPMNQGTTNFDNVTYYETQQRNQQTPSTSFDQVNGQKDVPNLQWNFFGNLDKQKDDQRKRRKSEQEGTSYTQTLQRTKKDEYWRLRKSAQNVNTVSIWCAENDERNAIIFHHESEVVENCSGNNYLQYLSENRFQYPMSNGDSKIKTKSSEVLNNTLEAQSKASGSLINMQRNVFSRSTSNIYNISSDFKVFEKQTNLSRDSINLSHNYLSSPSSSQSSLYNANHLINHNLNKVLNTSRAPNNPHLSHGQYRNFTNVENNLSINLPTIQYEKPSHLQNLTAQNQLRSNNFTQESLEIDNSYFFAETSNSNNMTLMNNSSSTEVMLNSTDETQSQSIWRRQRLLDPIGFRGVLRIVQNSARKYLQSNKSRKNNN